MRRALIAAALVTLTVMPITPVHAQKGMGGVGRGEALPGDPKPQFDEKKYKRAIEAIPDQQNNDPWAGARSPTVTQGDTTTTTTVTTPRPKR